MDTPDQLLALPDSLFETSAVADFTGEISLPEIRMGADSYRFEEPLRYHLFFTNTGGALLATGEVSGRLRPLVLVVLTKWSSISKRRSKRILFFPVRMSRFPKTKKSNTTSLSIRTRSTLPLFFRVRSHLLCRSWCFVAKTAPVFALNVALTSTTKPAVVLRSKKSIRRTRLRCSRTTASILKSNDCSRTSCESLPFGQNRNFDD